MGTNKNGTGTNKLPGNWYYIRKLIQHPDSLNVIFAATSMGLYKTDNVFDNANNVEWRQVLDDQLETPEPGTENHMGFFDIEYHKENHSIMFMTIEYRAEHEIEGNEILWSTDWGETWDMLHDADDYLPVTDEYDFFLTLLELTEADDDIMYIYAKGKDSDLGNYNEMWEYNIDTEAWTPLNCPFGDGNGRNGFTVHPKNADYLYAATVNVYVSTNGGISWAKDNNDCTVNGFDKKCPHSDVQDIKFTDSGWEIWAASDGGPFYKYDRNPSATWVNKVNEVGVAIIHYFDQSKIDPDYYVFGGYDVHSQLYDKELTQYEWTDIGIGDGYGCAMDNDELGTFYASNANLIYRFVNWQLDATINPGTDYWTRHVTINTGNHNTIYTSNGDDIYRSFDQGDTWETLVALSDFGISTGNYTLYDMHVAEGDSNYLYLRTNKTKSSGFPRIYKTTNVNESDPSEIQWSMLNPYAPPYGPPLGWIGDIEVDYEDPDRIWTCYNQSSGNKVWEYNGTTWTDLTENLDECNAGINSLAHLHGTDHELFASGLHGVFYLEDDTDDWVLYKPGIPTVSKPNLKINYCTGKIVAGTKGRGMWETDLPTDWDDAPEVNSDTTWNGYRVIMSPVYVPYGKTLTITGEVAFTSEGGIVVERGGELIIDGGILTNTCGDLWYGIEVQGTSTALQTSTAQGTVEVKNGGTIQNSENGIYTGKTNPFGTSYVFGYTGGIIKCDSAFFINNELAVRFLDYSHSSVSHFIETTFESNDGYIGTTDPYYFVKIYSMTGVDFTYCNFINNTSEDQYHSGVYCYNSSVNFEGDCTGGDPCTEWDEGLFENLEFGIKAYYSSASTKYLDIRHTEFVDNFRALYITGSDGCRVTSNTFEIDEPFVTNGGCGMYLYACTGYWIEENSFFHDGPGEIPKGLGLVVHNSGDDPNEIYRNTFDRLEHGILAQEQNRSTTVRNQGLQILCNDFDNSDADIAVPEPSTTGWGVNDYQGVNGTDPEDMAGNLFYIESPTPDDDYDDLNNEGNYFRYVYPSNPATGYGNSKPIDLTKNTIGEVIKLVNNTPPYWYFDDGCPSQISSGGGGGGLKSTGSGYKAQLVYYTGQVDSVEATLQELVDGGNTEVLNTEVELSTPPETMEVYTELMGESPNLSETVVESAIKKETVLPNAMVRDLMVANPHSAGSDILMEKLDERVNPMPNYMKAQVLEARNNVSLKEELESKLSGLKLRQARAFNGIVRQYLADTIDPQAGSDSLVSLFQSFDDKNIKYRLAMLHLQRGEYQTGSIVLNAIPAEYDLSTDELQEHNNMLEYFNLVKGIKQSGRTELDLTETEITEFMNIMQLESGSASIYARNILIALDKIDYLAPIQVPDLYKSKEQHDQYLELLNTKPPSQLAVFPNPSKDYVIVEYHLEIETTGIIEVKDVNGIIVEQVSINRLQDQVTVKTQEWKPGLYIATLVVDGKPLESCKFTLVK